MRIDTLRDKKGHKNDRVFPFRFNSNWVLEDQFEDKVKQGWELNEVELPLKLEELGKKLKE